jgi:hypothetical protein
MRIFLEDEDVNALLRHLAQDEEALLDDLYLDGTADQDVAGAKVLVVTMAVVVV